MLDITDPEYNQIRFNYINQIVRKRADTFTINPDFSVNIHGSYRWLDEDKGKITIAKVTEHFICKDQEIESLQKIIPSYIGGDLVIMNTNVNSLKDIHKIVKHIGGKILINNLMTNVLSVMLIEGVKKITSYEDLYGTSTFTITANVVGAPVGGLLPNPFITIKQGNGRPYTFPIGNGNAVASGYTFNSPTPTAGQTRVANYDDVKNLNDVCSIINRHLLGDRDIILCQQDLIDAGYGKFAKL